MATVYSLCGTVGANTGPIACDVRRGLPKGLVFGAASFAPNQYATQALFQAAFVAAMQSAAGSPGKLYPFPEIQGNTDQTDADKTGTLGYGLKQILLQGKPAYQFDMIAGTTQEKALRKFNNTTIPVFVFDDGQRVWGVTDASLNFTGAQVLVSVKGKSFDDGNNVKTTTVTISFINTSDFYDNQAFAQTSFGLGDLQGLVDVALSEVSAHTTNVFHIQAKVPTAQLGQTLNPYDYFGAALAAGSLWAVTSGGTTVPITSVAQVAGTKSWDVTLDTTAFAALASGAKISIGWVNPAALITAGVNGTEVPQALVVTK